MPEDKVTLRDIYDAVSNLEEKVDARLNRLEERTSKLESFRSQIAILGSLLVIVVTFLGDQIKQKVFGGGQ